MNASQTTGYSSKVEIQLLVAGHRLNVARIRGDQLVLRDKIDLPPTGEAKVIITVDGEETVTPIVLRRGINSQSDVIEFSEACPTLASSNSTK